MPSIRGRMALGNYIFHFFFRDTTTKDSVRASFKELGFIPIIVF
jgi:hypothetical protein